MGKSKEKGGTSDGWKRPARRNSLEEVHGTVAIPHGSIWRKLLAFSGPGFLVAVGYMDPGNWATDIAGGARFGYRLLCIIMASNLLAMLLQALAAKLGIVTGRDLAQACRDHFSRPVSMALWIICELAISACDLAEIIGSAIALNLLFGLPLIWGVCVTALDTLLILHLQNRGFRYLEAFIVALVLMIGACFLAEILLSGPKWTEVAGGLIPRLEIIENPQMLYLAIGILGATVMPHNLYLHSSVVQTRNYAQTDEGKREAVRFAVLDSSVALFFAFFINAAILITSAATFHAHGQYQVHDIREAYNMLSPTLGVQAASVLFAIALLASGQNSTLTGTLAGQIVMEGFLDIRLRPWLRRLLTRLIALIPVVAVLAYHSRGTMDQQFEAIGKLLILSQVILSLQLSFAVIPLILFTNDPQKMGQFVNGKITKTLAWLAAALIVVLNLKYVLDFLSGKT